VSGGKKISGAAVRLLGRSATFAALARMRGCHGSERARLLGAEIGLFAQLPVCSRGLSNRIDRLSARSRPWISSRECEENWSATGV